MAWRDGGARTADAIISFGRGPRQITWLSTQPAKLIEEFRTAPEATSVDEQKRVRHVSQNPAFQFSSGMQCQSRIPFRKSSLERPVLRQAFLKSCRQIVGDIEAETGAQQQNSDALFRCL
ncbi:Hypothetical_protein [Hexamita inflata]|uniref:Hypothetical_protein n=1 Tax=Hexamita inflata TaxID=28002 RepID=A0AA86TKJ7_9EUKA|nr:Hypothetical protein HINF_LOCUS9044 [Hexamita inflata]